MKLRIYLDTSTFSAYFDDRAPEAFLVSLSGSRWM